MKRKLLGCLAAIALGAAISAATPALAFRGGGMHGGFGGMHSGFGGMHGGFGGMRGGFNGMRVAGPAMGGHFHNAVIARGFHNRRFHNVVVVGAPFGFYGAGYGYDDGCWRQVWTAYGWQWVNIC